MENKRDLIQTLSHYQFSPETQYLDRKSARKKPSELLKHLIAFANADGGQLVIGIEDDKQNNIITGFKDGKAYPIDEFKKIDREMRETPLDLSFEEIPVLNHKGEEDVILVISVELSSNRVIAAPNDEVYLRQGDETVKLSYEQRTQLSYDKGQRFFEDEVVAESSMPSPTEITLSMATIFVCSCLMTDWKFIAQESFQISSPLTISSMNGFQGILGLPEP